MLKLIKAESKGQQKSLWHVSCFILVPGPMVSTKIPQPNTYPQAVEQQEEIP
jgi:hypothetical protein